MMYINTTTLEYPLSQLEIISRHPNCSFPVPFEPLPEYAEIVETAQPTTLFTKKLTFTVVFNNNRWEQVWTEEELSQIELAEKYASVRADLITRIKSIRDSKTQTGGYKVGTNWFHSDTFSRTQQLALKMEGENLATGVMWKTMDGTFIEMTPTLAQQIFSAAIAQDTALFSHAEYLQTLVNISPDPGSIDIDAGWPETFNNV